MSKIYSWTVKWRMKINIAKTKICLFTKQPDSINGSDIEISLQQQKLRYNHTPKLLGIVLDESLNFQTHITKVEQKASKPINTLRQVKYVENISTKKLLQLYKALVLPVLEYRELVIRLARVCLPSMAMR